MVVAIRQALAAEGGLIERLYREWGYRRHATAEAVVLLAESDGVPIGIVRLESEHGVTLLRGMRVADAEQRCGVGTILLNAIAAKLGDEACWCIPWRYLGGFYGRAGFEEVAAEAPPMFIGERMAAYRAEGLDVILMLRPTSA